MKAILLTLMLAQSQLIFIDENNNQILEGEYTSYEECTNYLSSPVAQQGMVNYVVAHNGDITYHHLFTNSSGQLERSVKYTDDIGESHVIQLICQ